MIEDKNNSKATTLLIASLTIIIHFLDYILVNNLWEIDPNSIIETSLFNLFLKFQPKLWIGRAITLAFSYGFFLFSISSSNKTKINKVNTILQAIVSSGIFVVGYLNYPLYNQYVFPIISLWAIWSLYRLSLLYNVALEDQEFLSQNSQEKVGPGEIDLSITLESHDKGNLIIHHPEQGILTKGGNGTGKSVSVFHPVIYQMIMKATASFIYDYKGAERPLSKVAYASWLHLKKTAPPGMIIPEFDFLGFEDNIIRNTGKINPIAPRYVKSYLYAQNMSTVFFKTLEKEWITKTDFWAGNAMLYGAAIIWGLKKLKPDYCTLPHFITLVLSPIEVVLKFLSQDREMKYLVAPIMNAYKKEVHEQLTGAESTAQVPITKMFSKEIFWVMSKDEIDLNISDPKKPRILCVANHESNKESLSPIISVIAQTVKMNLNDQKEFLPCLFSLDELPTLFILGIDEGPNEMRSKNVVFHLGIQLDSQIEDDYGKKAKRTKGAPQNVLIGGTGDFEDAEKTAKFFGEIDKVQASYTESDSGISRTYSLRKEKVFQAHEIASQPRGHMVGKIAGGKPPLFSCQLKDGSIHKLLKVDKKDIQDIPYNSKPIQSENIELSQKVLSELMERNFRTIINQVEELLLPFSPPAPNKNNKPATQPTTNV